MVGMIAAAQSSNWGIWAAVSAVIIDSIVTIIVGWRLNRTAKRETSNALEQVKPALRTELENAATLLIPLIVDIVKRHLEEKGKDG